MPQKRRRRPERRNAAPSLQFVRSAALTCFFIPPPLLLGRLIMMSSRKITPQLLQRQLLPLKLSPVIILRSYRRNQHGVEDRREARGDGAVDAGEDFARCSDGDGASEAVCRGEPDGQACGETQDGREDCGGFALAAPEDGEDHGEDAGAGYDA